MADGSLTWGPSEVDRVRRPRRPRLVRALVAWRSYVQPADISRPSISQAIQRGFEYLQRVQQADGSWIPLWFGNQDHALEQNPVYGTAKTLLAYRDAGRLDVAAARRGLQWLRDAQNRDGGWGGPPLDGGPRNRRQSAGSLASG